ncbi:MAG: hypothetical protein OFPI_29370 [Osedax symbiont Rs2]|nr:MAG: hypothetical protein OFPI_29370 [Osedax symbiont Rs2]
MFKRSTSIILALQLAIASTSIIASGFFTNMDDLDVQKIFDQADKSNTATLLTNSGPIPAIQILPTITESKTTIKAATQCIKLYSCNQGICLIDINNIKYATSEVLLKQFSEVQTNNDACLATANEQPLASLVTSKKAAANIAKNPAKKATAKFLWVKVNNVNANDSLNIRQSANYKSKKLASAAFNSSCIKRFKCQGKWCAIEYKGVSGWVHNKYLSKMAGDNLQQCQK